MKILQEQLLDFWMSLSQCLLINDDVSLLFESLALSSSLGWMNLSHVWTLWGINSLWEFKEIHSFTWFKPQKGHTIFTELTWTTSRIRSMEQWDFSKIGTSFNRNIEIDIDQPSVGSMHCSTNTMMMQRAEGFPFEMITFCIPIILDRISDLLWAGKMEVIHTAHLFRSIWSHTCSAFEDPVDGALFVFYTSDETVPQRFVSDDPYFRNGLVKNYTIRKWTCRLSIPRDLPD